LGGLPFDAAWTKSSQDLNRKITDPWHIIPATEGSINRSTAINPGKKQDPFSKITRVKVTGRVAHVWSPCIASMKP
jgi:hypothetical protein